MVSVPAQYGDPGRTVFVTGGTGYLGSRLIPLLHARGYHVRALVRQGSTSRLPGACEPVIGDALEHGTFSARVRHRHAARGGSPLRVRERGPASAGDARVHRCAHARRVDDRRRRSHRHDREAVVRAGPGTSMALRARSAVLGARAYFEHPGFGATPGSRHRAPDATSVGGGRGASAGPQSRVGRTGDPRRGRDVAAHVRQPAGSVQEEPGQAPRRISVT